ncbi:MAG: molybdopterin-guanine dinucleotide biosynthesis protein B [Firmicutes bacterium]|nr:molybdopterin-guanine dinucleotide biosynthesis protein B [Bacillota bacterium]
MIPLVGFVGQSNAGKTTLIEKVIRELKARGYRLATLKHHHGDFEIDREGKDTWRHARAGADTVVLASPTKVAMIKKLSREMSLAEVAALVTDVDLIIVEGYKQGPQPKIEVFRSAVQSELVCSPRELLAVASDVPLNLGIPCFSLDDPVGLADFIASKFLKPGG